MNEYQSELPKDEKNNRQRIKKNEFHEAIIKINSYIAKRDFSKAYTAIEQLKPILNSRAYYTDEQRDRLRKVAIYALEKELEPQIKKEYIEAMEFYKLNYRGTELKESPYPESIDRFASYKAKEQLMETYRTRRFGGYMHVVINNIIKKYDSELAENIKTAERRNNINRRINAVKRIGYSDWER